MKRFVAVLALCALIAGGTTGVRAERPSVRDQLRARGGPSGSDAFSNTSSSPSRGLPAMAPAKSDSLSRAHSAGRISGAQYALERARSLFRPGYVRARYGADIERPDPHAASIIMRDLALRLRHLQGEDRRDAEDILGRPTDTAGGAFGEKYPANALPKVTCSTNVCIHWVETSTHAVPLIDANGNAIPDWVDLNLGVFDGVIENDKAMGYRGPKDDTTSENNGGNGLPDVYLVNIGPDFLYGYCASDDPNVEKLGTPQYAFWDVSSFCALDNDYAEEIFNAHTEADNLRVTAAHEFFHAIQLNYDIKEDGWLLEGSAAWMEDLHFDDINDNYQYLNRSALTKPGYPIDYYNPDFNDPEFIHQYGAWLWWMFVSEYLSTEPGIKANEAIRQIWDRADGSPNGIAGDEDSLTATVRTVESVTQRPFRYAFADFGAVNFFPDTFYEEGAEYINTVGNNLAPALGEFTLTKNKPRSPATANFFAEIDHLSNGYVVYTPGTGIKSTAKLKVTLDLPQYSRGPEATLIEVETTGLVHFKPFTLKSDGTATKTVRFGKGKIAGVVLVLTNASTRYTCFQDTILACGGLPKDDVFNYDTGKKQKAMRFLFNAKAIQ